MRGRGMPAATPRACGAERDGCVRANCRAKRRDARQACGRRGSESAARPRRYAAGRPGAARTKPSTARSSRSPAAIVSPPSSTYRVRSGPVCGCAGHPLELALEDRDLLDIGQQRDAVAGRPCATDDRLTDRPAAVGRRLVLVVSELTAVADRPHVVGESHPGRVEVEVAHLLGGTVAEPVDDVGRHPRERPSRHDHLLILHPEPDRHLAGEHVEDVMVVMVDVWFAPSRPGPKRDQVMFSESASDRISTRRSGESPITSPPPNGMWIGTGTTRQYADVSTVGCSRMGIRGPFLIGMPLLAVAVVLGSRLRQVARPDLRGEPAEG